MSTTPLLARVLLTVGAVASLASCSSSLAVARSDCAAGGLSGLYACERLAREAAAQGDDVEARQAVARLLDLRDRECAEDRGHGTYGCLLPALLRLHLDPEPGSLEFYRFPMRLVPLEPERALVALEALCGPDSESAREPRACAALGAVHWLGRNAPQDRARAALLFTRACAGGMRRACEAVDQPSSAYQWIASDELEGVYRERMDATRTALARGDAAAAGESLRGALAISRAALSVIRKMSDRQRERASERWRPLRAAAQDRSLIEAVWDADVEAPFRADRAVVACQHERELGDPPDRGRHPSACERGARLEIQRAQHAGSTEEAYFHLQLASAMSTGVHPELEAQRTEAFRNTRVPMVRWEFAPLAPECAWLQPALARTHPPRAAMPVPLRLNLTACRSTETFSEGNEQRVIYHPGRAGTVTTSTNSSPGVVSYTGCGPGGTMTCTGSVTTTTTTSTPGTEGWYETRTVYVRHRVRTVVVEGAAVLGDVIAPIAVREQRDEQAYEDHGESVSWSATSLEDLVLEVARQVQLSLHRNEELLRHVRQDVVGVTRASVLGVLQADDPTALGPMVTYVFRAALAADPRALDWFERHYGVPGGLVIHLLLDREHLPRE